MIKYVCVFSLFACLCALAGTAHAATYVVSPAGSDTNPGTAAKPFQTIAKAADMARAGDKVVVRRGMYREEVHLRQSGTAAAPIQFVADPPGAVLVTGADVETGWTRVPGDAPVYSIPWNHVFAIDYHDGKPIEFHPDRRPPVGPGRAGDLGREAAPADGRLERVWAKPGQTIRKRPARPCPRRCPT